MGLGIDYKTYRRYCTCTLPETCPSFLSGKVFQSLVLMLERMARHTVKEHCQVVEKSLVQELQRLWSVWNDKQYIGEQEESLKSQIGFLLRLTNVWVSWKSGSLISDPVQLFNVSGYFFMYAVSIAVHVFIIWRRVFYWELNHS